MEDTFTCPKCHLENSYFDGLVFICPDCEHEWSEESETISSNNYLPDNIEFEELANLERPYFKLDHGKLYECKVRYEKNVEEMTIIPLAFKKGMNRQFIMIDARKLFNDNPIFVREIINMDFDFVYYDGIKENYPFDYSALTIICATQIDGTIIDYNNDIYFDFKEANDFD